MHFFGHLPWISPCIAVVWITTCKIYFHFGFHLMGWQSAGAPIRIPGIPAALSSWLILYSLQDYMKMFLELVQKSSKLPAEGANEVADGAGCFVGVWWVAVHLEQTIRKLLMREMEQFKERLPPLRR